MGNRGRGTGNGERGTGNVANVETANTNSLNSAIPHFHNSIISTLPHSTTTSHYLCVATTSSSSAYVGLMWKPVGRRSQAYTVKHIQKGPTLLLIKGSGGYLFEGVPFYMSYTFMFYTDKSRPQRNHAPPRRRLAT